MKTIKTLEFIDALGEHPGEVLFKQYISAYKDLSDVDKAQHKLANSIVYTNYLDAQKYGIHIYNQRTNGGRDPIQP